MVSQNAVTYKLKDNRLKKEKRYYNNVKSIDIKYITQKSAGKHAGVFQFLRNQLICW